MQYDPCNQPVCAQQVCWLPMNAISPRQHAPFGGEDSQSLTALAQSIARDGLIRPITVRRAAPGHYVILSGNRRYLACRMAGYTHIDAVVLEGDRVDCTAQQLLATLQTGRLHYLMEARGLEMLTTRFGISRDAMARCLGKTVGYVGQKIRLNELEEDVQAVLLEEDLPERCARALVRLPDHHARLAIAKQAAAQKLCIRDVELLVHSAMNRLPVPPTPGGKTIVLMRDHRLYVNAIRAIIAQMQEAGMTACMEEHTTGDSVQLTLRIPTRRPRGVRGASQR